MYPHFVFIA